METVRRGLQEQSRTLYCKYYHEYQISGALFVKIFVLYYFKRGRKRGKAEMISVLPLFASLKKTTNSELPKYYRINVPERYIKLSVVIVYCNEIILKQGNDKTSKQNIADYHYCRISETCLISFSMGQIQDVNPTGHKFSF